VKTLSMYNPNPTLFPTSLFTHLCFLSSVQIGFHLHEII
jgi:hypothetical protein